MANETQEVTKEQLKNELNIAQRKAEKIAERLAQTELLFADKSVDHEIMTTAYSQMKEEAERLAKENTSLKGQAESKKEKEGA